jgi:hypothetical protein
MEQFQCFTAQLTNQSKKDQQIELVKKVFDEQDIEIEHLSSLTLYRCSLQVRKSEKWEFSSWDFEKLF